MGRYIDTATSLAKCGPTAAPPATGPTALPTFHAFHHQTQAPFRLIDIHQSSYAWMVHAQEEFLRNWWSHAQWSVYDNFQILWVRGIQEWEWLSSKLCGKKNCLLQMRPNGNFVLQLFLCLCSQVSPKQCRTTISKSPCVRSWNVTMRQTMWTIFGYHNIIV